MKVKYEGNIGNYSFQMIDDSIIEIWGYDDDRPESFIYLKPGSVTSEKSFQQEISFWFMENVG